MADDLDMPRFGPSDPMFLEAVRVSRAGISGNLEVIFDMLKEHALDFMLHVDEDGLYCLHLPHIFGDDHGLAHDHLAHVLVVGMAHTLKYKQEMQKTARNN